jgi:DNA gyrase subunit A
MGRTASGVRGITLKDDSDEVIGWLLLIKMMLRFSILVVTENGYGKRTKLVDEDGEDVTELQIVEVKELKRLTLPKKQEN